MLANGQIHTQYSPQQYERRLREAAWRPERQSPGNLKSWDIEVAGSLSSRRGPGVGLLGHLDEWPGIADRRKTFQEQPDQAAASPNLHQKPTGLTEGFKKVCERWHLDANDMARLLHLEDEVWLSALILSGKVPPVTGDLKDRMALVIGISIGLGDLFDDSRDGELKWLNSPRSEFDSLSPRTRMLQGDLPGLIAVVDLLDHARGLK